MLDQKFVNKLNNVFQLMSENRIRNDIDDTLLEKLLSYIKSAGMPAVDNERKKKFLEELVQKTDALKLIEKALTSVGGKTKELSGAIEVFCIRMFGIILEIEDLFVSYKNSVLLESLFVILKYTDILSFSASVHDALLAFSLCIAKHNEGAKWSLERDVPDFVFKSFQSVFFYVRKSAVTFFATIIPMWSSKALSMPDAEKSLVNDFLKNILLKLISRIEFEAQPEKCNLSESCILALEELLATNDEQLCPLSEMLLNSMKSYLDNVVNENSIYSKIIDLLLKLFTLKPEIEPVLIDIMKSLLKQHKFKLAFHLASDIVRISEKCHPISEKHLNFLLLPFNVLADNEVETSDDVFHILPDVELYDNLKRIMKDRAAYAEILSKILSSLSLVTCLMDHQALETVIFSLHLNLCAQELEKHFYLTAVMRHRFVQFSVMDLFNSFETEKVYVNLSHDLVVIFYKHLLLFVERLSAMDYTTLASLNHLKRMITLSSKHNFQFPDELKEQIIQLLCKKLLHTRENVVDSALSLAAQIIAEDCSDWQEHVLQYDIHSIVWDLAVEGSCDGTIKATAINALTEICIKPSYWESISSIKGVSEMDVENILFNFSSDDDFLIQRAALNCLFKWAKIKWNTRSSTCRTRLLVALANAMKSLDLDLKIASLNNWLWLIENDNYFPNLSDTSDVEEYLKFLSDSGFGSSVLLAVCDYDEPVQFKGADILMKLRNKLIALGITKHYKPLESPVQIKGNSLEDVKSNGKLLSQEEKTAGIDSVLNLTTAQQIGNISRFVENKKMSSYKNYDFNLSKFKDVECSVSALWSKIWCNSIDSIAHGNKETDDITYAISLLDDIIAAEELSNSCSEDTPDCY